MLKRRYQGIFHKTSPKPWIAYVIEFAGCHGRLTGTRHYGWHGRWDGGQEASLQGVVGGSTVDECGSLISGTSELAEIRPIG